MHFWDRHWPLKDVTYFNGSGFCPDDRSKIVTAKINFKQASLKDIHQGTSVAVTSSLAAGFTVNAHMQAE
ncbi:MAG TPA: hypothetical protein VF412_05565 [Bdellovibrio sp.]|uniref:hypothetical protein n=1 Tax=Bdellovibrio sp. TaxID=28201 RepID=UPI002F1A8566